jgi:hypothetical protein
MDPGGHEGLALAPLERVDRPVETLVPRVPAGEPVELLLGAGRDQVDVAADLDPPAVVVGVEHQQRGPRVGLEVRALAALAGGVDEQVVADLLEPDRLALGPAVGQAGGEQAEQRPPEQLAMGSRDLGLVEARARPVPGLRRRSR